MEIENKTVETIPAITIRFAGDSGDGMQLVGTRFTDTSALFGNDLATLPAFPAEIRAPQGTIAGVSSFQVQIADFDILTPGDNPDVLVAMNPAALKAHLHDLAPNGMLILNEDAFEEKNITKAGYKVDPRESPTRIMSVYLSIAWVIFFEYEVRQTILDLFFKDLILANFKLTYLF